MATSRVLAAGGVVLRGEGGDREVLVVHRPAYDDWSLPKGKLDEGEDLSTAARREVLEETGVHGLLGPHVGIVDYRDRKGRPKRVHWWSMEATTQDPRKPDKEVDEVVWMPLDKARRRLTYRTDRGILATALSDRSSLLVVRHAEAGQRGSVDPDHERKLSRRGKKQRKALVHQLAGHRIDTIVSSPYKRCRQSMTKLARARGLDVVVDDRLREGTPVAAVLELVQSLPRAAVICSHGDVIGDLVSRFAAVAETPDDAGFDRLRWPKGSTWWVTLAGQLPTAAIYYEPTD